MKTLLTEKSIRDIIATRIREIIRLLILGNLLLIPYCPDYR